MASTTSRPDDQKPFTTESLLLLIEKLPTPIPDPLNGATVLWVTQELADKAHQIAAAAGRQIHVRVSPHAFPNRIYGFCGKEQLPCLVIKNEDPQ